MEPDNRHLQNNARNPLSVCTGLEATAPWGVKQENQTEEEVTPFRQNDATHRLGALRHAFARQLLAECGRDSGADSAHRW